MTKQAKSIILPEHCKRCIHYPPKLNFIQKLFETNHCLSKHCYCFHCNSQTNPKCPDEKAFAFIASAYEKSYPKGKPVKKPYERRTIF